VWQRGTDITPKPVQLSLHDAIEWNDSPHAISALARGASLRRLKHDRMSPLMLAASLGHIEMVKLLVSKGADTSETDHIGCTPLMYAVGVGSASDGVSSADQIAVAGALLAAGAQINAADHEGRTALMIAAEHGRAIVVNWLIQHGAEPNARTKENWTPLMQAASKGYSHTVQVLIDRGADVNALDSDGHRAIDLADPPNPAVKSEREVVELLKQAAR